jgi:hypothetical protein
MKLQAAGDTIRDIIGGTPAEVTVKVGLAAAAALWANLQTIGLSVLAYFILLIVDAAMGAMLSMRSGKKWDTWHFTMGPSKKFALTTLMLFCSAIVDTMIPGNFLFYGIAAFICATALIDVARKYGKLTGSRLVAWIENKLEVFIKVPEDGN